MRERIGSKKKRDPRDENFKKLFFASAQNKLMRLVLPSNFGRIKEPRRLSLALLDEAYISLARLRLTKLSLAKLS